MGSDGQIHGLDAGGDFIGVKLFSNTELYTLNMHYSLHINYA